MFSALKIIAGLQALFSLAAQLVGVWRDYLRLKREKEIKDAVDEAVATGDQRKLEEVVGSDNAGKPTTRSRGVRERASSSSSGPLED